MPLFTTKDGILKEIQNLYADASDDQWPSNPRDLLEVYTTVNGVLRKIHELIPQGKELIFIRNDQITQENFYTFPAGGEYCVYAVGNGGNGGRGGDYSGWTYGGGGGSGGTGGFIMWQSSILYGSYLKYYRNSNKTVLEWYDQNNNLTNSAWVSDGTNGGDGENAWPSFNPDNGVAGTGGQAFIEGDATTKIALNGSNGNEGNRMHGASANAPPSGYKILQPQYIADQKQAAYADYEIPDVVLGNAGGGGHSGFGGDGSGGAGAFGGILVEFIRR